MAEESDLERTEPASERRIEKAREEGQVPQSRELVAFAVLASGGASLWLLGDWFAQRAKMLLREKRLSELQRAALRRDVERIDAVLERTATSSLAAPSSRPSAI